MFNSTHEDIASANPLSRTSGSFFVAWKEKETHRETDRQRERGQVTQGNGVKGMWFMILVGIGFMAGLAWAVYGRVY